MLTVDTAFSRQTIDVVSGAPTLAWTQTTASPEALVEATPSSESIPEYAKSGAKVTSLSASEAPHVTPWDPVRGWAGEGKVWVVVPYALNATIAPEGFSESSWLAPAVEVDGRPVDPAPVAPLMPGEQQMAFQVPETTSGKITITPRVQVGSGGQQPDPANVATFDPLTFTFNAESSSG
jgi:hypothetical protein